MIARHALRLAVFLVVPLLAPPARGAATVAFELACTNGTTISPQTLAARGIGVVVFLAPEAASTGDLVRQLDTYQRAASPASTSVAAMIAGTGDAAKAFAAKHHVAFAACADTGGNVAGRYDIRERPAAIVLGPGGLVADAVPGAGSAKRPLLLVLAEKELARGNLEIARTLFDAVPPGPAAVDARLGAILALVRLHRLDAAAKALDAIRRAPGAEAAVSIGQAAISLASGSAQIAADALAPAPAGAALTQLGRGEVAAARGDHDAARRAFTAASTAEPPVPWIRANAFVYASRLTSDAGSALGLLDQAVAADPLFLHAWTDRAVLLADAGRVADAQATLATAQALAPDDELVVALRAALDAPRPAVADVEAMAAAFTAGAKAKRLGTWEASKPALATVLMRDTLGPLSPRGQGAAFLAGLFAALDTNPRLRVAPRGITDALTTRLGLTPESLESPSTLQRLGAVLDTPALLLGGTYSVDGKAQLQLRLMSAIQAEAVTTLAEDLGDPARVTTAARAAADRIATAVRVKFPLHGEVTALSGDLLVLTVTAAHGVRVGDGFRVVADARPITVGDRTVGYQQRLVGTVTVTEVGETSSRAKPTTGGPFEAGQHVVEIAEP